MADDDQTPWLAGLPEEPAGGHEKIVLKSDVGPSEPASAPPRPKREKPQPAAPTKTKYEPFHW